MKEVTVNQLVFKRSLSTIEQMSLKNIMYNFIGSPDEGLEDILPLKYTESVFAKLELPKDTNFMIHNNETLRFVTLTEDNQIVIGCLNSNCELKFNVLFLEDRLEI